MSSYPDTYTTISSAIENGVRFLFMSEGKFSIIKIVDYVYALDYKDRPVYNLAFGDYDVRTRTLSDDEISNNGDAYRVFHTVLATIPSFFFAYPNAMLMIWGSDSRKEFLENCRTSCKKNCGPEVCRNAHRRITIYRNFVNKNFARLSLDYKFYGGSLNDENQILVEDYKKSRPYPAIILRKKRRKNS